MKIIKQPVAENHQRDSELTKTVAAIIDRVRNEGDRALLAYAEQFDHVKLDSLRVSPETIRAAYDQIDAETLETIRFSASQIETFAKAQRDCMKDLNMQSVIPGLEIGHRLIPVERCACYVPAGLHPLPSTALMTIVTARCAGVRHIAACSPAVRG